MIIVNSISLLGKRFRLLCLFTLLGLFSVTDANAQIIFGPGPQTATYTYTHVRGYHFTADTNFNICQVWVDSAMNTNMWHVEVVRFTNGAPPAFPGTTNNFVSLFYADSVTSTFPLTTNIPVATGDIIGIYGARSTAVPNQLANSYDGTQPTTNILGTTPTLYRSGMQFPLNNQQMHDIWSEINYNTCRVFGFHSCCPTAPTPQGPITGPTSLCQGDTVTYWIPWDTNALSYVWTIPNNDTIISGQGDSLIQVVIGSGSLGGQICVAMVDTCNQGPDTCITYTINQPAAPGPISGTPVLCENTTATYSVPPVATANSYSWTVPAGAVINSGQGTPSISVTFGASSGKVCVGITDDCAGSDSTCYNVTVSLAASPAVAGPDRYMCSGMNINLAAQVPSTGSGVWRYISAPNNNPGVIQDTTLANSSFTALDAGEHVLIWRVSTPGCDPNIDTMIVNVLVSPTANFTFETGCEGAPITFEDQSSGNGSSIGSLYWDMNSDGIFDHYNSPVDHNFQGSGVFSVRLIATNLGCADTINKNVNVYPKAYINLSTAEVCQGVPTQITNTSTLASGNLDSLIWSFGDGNGFDTTVAPNLVVNPNVTYGSEGIYTIVLKAITDQGCFSQGSTTAEVFANPVARFFVENACQFQTTSFSDSSEVAGADIALWNWNLGDGGTTSTMQHPSHDYNTSGMTPVSLSVESSQGCTDDTTVSVEIFPTPVTDFNFTNRVCNGQTTTLDQVSTLAYGNFDSFEWLVIDDSFSFVGPSFDYTFDSVGNYDVMLTSISEEGCMSSITKSVPVYESPIADFKFNNACEDIAINFRDSTKFSKGIETITWNFKDGTDLVHEQYPTHTFDTFGTYNVSLIVESFHGCMDSVSYPVKIYERVNPRFGVMADSGCSPFTAVFVDSTISQTGRELTYSWNYGNGVVREDTAYFEYENTTGRVLSYGIRLDIYSDQNCKSTYYVDSMVYVLPQPIADFESDPDLLDAIKTTNPLVQFKSTSQQANWLKWTFGDGTSSNEKNPSHQFKTEGQYEITLIAKNFLDCRDTIRKMAFVEHANVPFIPSAFSPNDDHINDYFFIQGLQNVTDVKMSIYDRWGNLVFEGEGLDTKWDGTDSQSGVVQQGVYLYRVIYQNAESEEVELEGRVTVIGVNK